MIEQFAIDAICNAKEIEFVEEVIITIFRTM